MQKNIASSSMPADLFIGLDIGTSGARAIAMTQDGAVAGSSSSPMRDHGADHRAPKVWLGAAKTTLAALCATIERPRVKAICVDGTSGTMLPVDKAGQVLAAGRMYNDPCDNLRLLEQIATHAPATSAAHGATSGLAKVMMLQDTPDVAHILHQADWIAEHLCGVRASDDNNALKTGYDPVTARWPDWMARTGAQMDLLPDVRRPGTPLGAVRAEIAAEFDLPAQAQVVTGTTDGCAAFLATGAAEPGEGVTSLGTTLVLKLLSEKPIFAPESGIYSHHIMGLWLAGGASNTGGGVLLEHFSETEIASLSREIDTGTALNLGYYPLREPGERFPIADPTYPARMEPRPDARGDFLKAMLEGIADVEALGYSKLHELGGPALRSVRTVGGGAQNTSWTRMRTHALSVPILAPLNGEAAYGAAVLARYGMRDWL